MTELLALASVSDRQLQGLLGYARELASQRASGAI
jgi:hypothetical protein